MLYEIVTGLNYLLNIESQQYEDSDPDSSLFGMDDSTDESSTDEDTSSKAIDTFNATAKQHFISRGPQEDKDF